MARSMVRVSLAKTGNGSSGSKNNVYLIPTCGPPFVTPPLLAELLKGVFILKHCRYGSRKSASPPGGGNKIHLPWLAEAFGVGGLIVHIHYTLSKRYVKCF